MEDTEAPARYGLPDRLRVRAGKVGAWVHVVGSLQRIFCGAGTMVLVAIGAVGLWSGPHDPSFAAAVLGLLALAWLGLRHARMLEDVGNELISASRGGNDPHGALEGACSRLCSVLLLEAIFAAALSVAVATAVVLA